MVACAYIYSLTEYSSLAFSFSGTFNIFVKADGTEKLVGCYDNRGSFGELALMYNTPRAATIIATSPGALLCLVSKLLRFFLYVVLSVVMIYSKYQGCLWQSYSPVLSVRSCCWIEKKILSKNPLNATNGERALIMAPECKIYVFTHAYIKASKLD